MSTMKLPGGLEVKVKDVGEPDLESLDSRIQESLQEMYRFQNDAIRAFRAAAAQEPDPTLYELIEEWNQDTRKIRWYYRKR